MPMIHSQLKIGSEDYYSSILTKQINVKITLVAINREFGFGFIESLNNKESDIEEYVKGLKSYSDLIDLEITHKSSNRYWTKAQQKYDGPSIYDTILESGSMTQLPITIYNGLQSHKILSPDSDSFSRLLELLHNRFSHVEVRSSYSHPQSGVESLLTEKQFEIFSYAWENGYYEIPKKAYMQDLANILGMKRVSAQELLRRAEKRIMKDYYDKSSPL